MDEEEGLMKEEKVLRGSSTSHEVYNLAPRTSIQ